MSQVLIGSQSKNFKALEAETKETSSAQRPNAALCQAMTEQAQDKICAFSSPTEWRASLRDQITEIGKIDPQKASRLSQKILFYQGRQGELAELQEEGLEVSNRPHFPGLPGGMMRESEWRQGPRMCFTGKEYRIEIFHIPAGYRYKDYRTPTWELSGQASCSITHVVGDSKTSIDELQNSSSSKKMQALLQAKGLQAIDVGAVAESNRAEQAGAASASNRSHSHEAIVITGKTKYQMRGYARLNVAIEILLEPIPQNIPSTAETKSSETLPPITLKYAEEKEETEAVEEEKSSRRAAASSQRTAPMFEEDKKAAAPTHRPSSSFKATRKSSSPSPTRPRPNTPLRRQSSTNFNPTIPPEEASPLLAQKLRNPHQELSIDESIQLLTTCVKYGNERAQNLQGKEGIIVIGNTGAGKSTMVNYLAGCTMELKSPDELEIEGFDPDSVIDDIVVVRPSIEGGRFDEIMPIGHTKESKTFMPQIETDPDQRFTYCDCPGFLDNRGAEINIANAVNVRTAITQAQSVKVVILINYHSLRADRGRGLSDMLKICSNLFGHPDNLVRYQDSILLGVTQAPLSWKLERVKRWIVKDTPDIMATLAERIFLSDPLDRPLAEGGWDRDTCLSHLETLAPIENPSAIFKTVLTDSDERKLLEITEQMGEQIQEYLQEKNFASAASRLRHLQNLSVIEHITVERLLNQNVYQIGRFFQKTVDDFKTHCNFEHFSSAEILMQELRAALDHFEDDLEEVINISRLENYYQETQERYQDRVERERIQEERLKKAQGQVEELLHLLEEQKQTMHQQLQAQEEKFQGMLQEMQSNIESTQASYSQMQETLRQEMNERLAQKDEELSLAQSLSQEARLEIEQSRARLEAEYAQKLEAAEQEKAQLLQSQEAEKAQRAQEMAEQNARAEEKIRAIEAQQAQKVAELQSTALPRIAFGKAEWERYFGEVGEQPPLPADIGEILSGPCPYWEGRRVEDTHLLVLIPQSVNGAPLTLNSLKELIQRPCEGGHNTDYGYYNDNIKNELGDQGASHSYWALMTKDVLPNSRNKTFSEQQALIQGPYVVPGALEAATAILMHHAKGGEKLYPMNPTTYTRCQEMLSTGYRVVVGSFGSSGLGVLDDYDVAFRVDDGGGLGGVRKF